VKRIELHYSFIKGYAKRIAKDEKICKQYEKRIDMFIVGHRDAPINDHMLTGDLQSRRAFSITGAIRIVYVESEDKIIFLDVGSHNQVY
jgi:addiction module RelE/StbE family toxin